MILDLDALSPAQTYFQMIQTLIPRPIAWVLSEHAGGSLNLAPFSYFTAVCAEPPLVLISVGHKPDGSLKDTRVNIEERDDFVIHIAHREMLEAMNASSATLPAGVSEVEKLGLATVPFPGSRLPRLAAARVAYACKRFEIREIGPGKQSLIIGRITHIYLDDTIIDVSVDGRIRVDAESLDPIARLGASEYAMLSEVVRLKRPA
ncbi:MAG TPA: flavin reductase family protein [Mariprofundaceae bacterium]|nr:flavin reductase family protein [Mariprofundaceae bacterium]